ncbi:MAG: ribosome maturation factor RimP [Nitrospirota bacterium]
MNDITQKILKLAEQIAGDQEVEIADIELLGKGKTLLRVYIDKGGGVTLDDCERFSKSFGALLDVESIIRGPYTLEVSSPGLDRPLKTIEDFRKSIGKLARIVTSEKIDNQNFFLGRIVDVRDTHVRIRMNDREMDIPIDRVAKARLEIEI